MNEDLDKWIEQFTASPLETGRCDKLYINVAKYEPIKGSSYIQLPKAIADKKAIINIKNNDERCLEWVLISEIYPDKSHHSNQESCYRKHLGKDDETDNLVMKKNIIIVG